MIELYSYQKEAVEKLRSGSILCGGVGSGKSLTALCYYYQKESGQRLYIITTAKKRNSDEWDNEINNFQDIWYIVDSWQNIVKYENISNAFFIFDEQRVVGSGAWVKSFLKITKNNRWILLSATPGDSWMDYIPVFIANGFYKNRTEFIRRHVVYNPRVKFPKVERYLEQAHLMKLQKQILVTMDYTRDSNVHREVISVEYDVKWYFDIMKKKWNPWKEEPIRNASELCYALRKIVNSDFSRLKEIKNLLAKHPKIIIFYNFDYELELLLQIKFWGVTVHQYNGHKHEEVPDGDEWVYLVQYGAGAEGWNCVRTNTILFYSLNYSYKMMKQAAGRIDRLNTPYKDLYYYYLYSPSSIDIAIGKALSSKKDFNAKNFAHF